jgi:hypothetical protein
VFEVQRQDEPISQQFLATYPWIPAKKRWMLMEIIYIGIRGVKMGMFKIYQHMPIFKTSSTCG